METAVGVQQIRVAGAPPTSHFARVMVAADFQMKRLAMGFEKSGSGVDSYLDLLREDAARFRHVSAPRWWLALDPLPVRCSPDGLAWQLTDQGVRVMTEDGYLTAVGRIGETDSENPHAVRWAESMTAAYRELSQEFPVFAQLRNCMNMAIVASLIQQQRLVERTGCDLSLLVDQRHIRGPSYNVPRTVDSAASFVSTRRGWVVSISGGVEIDAWRVLRRPLEEPALATQWDQAAAARGETAWWWEGG
jgi:hypothetical protein